jgi:hypothetical protein
MLHINRIVSTFLLALGVAALIAPAAEARPAAATPGNAPAVAQTIPLAGSATATRAIVAVPPGAYGTEMMNLLHSGSAATANAYQVEMQTLLHPGSGPTAIRTASGSASDAGFDWTPTFIAVGFTCLILLGTAGFVGIRRRGQLAT